MRTTVKDFNQALHDLMEKVIEDYPDIGAGALCHMLHKDLGLGTTPRANAEERRAELAEQGVEIEEDALDLTVEHRELHVLIAQLLQEGLVLGLSSDQLLAMMLLIGRRYGLAEAAGTLPHEDVEEVNSLEKWLNLPSPDEGSDTADPGNEFDNDGR